ncbi:hypothetical protein ACWEV3_32690 [Saccharopolyspora sp. NPDC003752]
MRPENSSSRRCRAGSAASWSSGSPLTEGLADEQAIDLLTDLTHRGLNGK